MSSIVAPCTNYTCNHVVGSPNLASGEIEYTAYGYWLNNASVYAFLALFCLSWVIHVLQTTYYRKIWTFFTLGMGCGLEAVGWGGRLWSIKTTYWQPAVGGFWDETGSGFIMQIVCLIIAPTFFSAANYIFLGNLVRETGGRYTSITSSSISWIFTFADFICLVIQGIGGGITGTSDDWETFNHGIKIMAIGVVVQLAVTAIFIVLFAEFAWRYKNNRPATRQRDLLFWAKWLRCWGRRREPAAVTNWEEEKEDEAQRAEPSRRLMWISQAVLAFATILIIIRSVYRAIELLSLNHENKSSSIYYDQPAFIALDAAMMCILVFTYNVVHPGLVNGRPLF
ncbi:Sphingoid long-chain base transporter RSB1 [Vanrija pseudolonga]|uniref:Sphingoid long-chain base transporter RSB1 n=1 Tax=Vanrija pseudolonga TaxID=143232 RepID=A0AAF0YDS9_9TREE|nr:Sphingoid long-chain base transporter RSB1 [Vanrija pseudolonga]